MRNACLTTQNLGAESGSRIWEHFPLEKFSQFMALRSPLRFKTVPRYAVLSVITVVLDSETEQGHHVDVTCQPSLIPMVTHAERVR